MPFQRAIAVLLLVTCGLPLAVGPHWHSHDHAAGASCSANHAESSSDGEHGGCAGHACSSEVAEADGHAVPGRVFAAVDAGDAGLNSEDCSTCHFYSSHVVLSQTAPAEAWELSCVAYEVPRGEAARVEPHVYLARGPPALVS